ncbi:MAG: energy transducer TonB [Pseudodonghicola sp.]|nr:energy transducer TonB [Pseudodonghicola sp.]
MQTGTKISAVAHGLLLSWAFLGGAFRSDPLPYEVQDVTMISSEEFDRIAGHSATPEAVTTLSEPQPAPEPIAEPVVEPRPDPVSESVPPKARPEPTPPPPPPAPEIAALVPEPPSPPQRAVERIAPEPVAPPPPEARPDPVEREQVTPEANADTPQEAQDATAPEEAAAEIVTEAEETAVLAPTRSPRPAARPARRPPPAPETAPASETETATDTATETAAKTEDAVTAALTEAMAGAREATPAAPAAPSGPPMSAGEKEALRVAVSSCWNVGSLSSDALATTVVVAVSLSQDGKPQGETIRMASHSGGSEASAKQAFEAARRAIIRCGAKGFDLPVAKYDHWRNIEMTFNPERMRIK